MRAARKAGRFGTHVVVSGGHVWLHDSTASVEGSARDSASDLPATGCLFKHRSQGFVDQ